MIYLIFSLFILYTVLCCLDGPDLKPKWRNWLGHKLHKYTDKYVSYNPLFVSPKYEIPIYETRYVPLRLQSNINLSEYLISCFENSLDKDRYIRLAKKGCIDGLINQIKKHKDDLIKIEEIENPWNGSIDIRAEMHVCTLKENYRNYSNIEYSELENNKFADLRHDR